MDLPHLHSLKHQQQHLRANRKGAHPDILEFEKVFIKRTKALGIPMWAFCVIRTPQEQADLYDDGYSKDSPEDGIWPHKAGAVDLVHGVRLWNLDRKEWAVLGHIGKEVANAKGIKVEWGGDWKFYDPAHWQLGEWRRAAHHYPWPEMPNWQAFRRAQRQLKRG